MELIDFDNYQKSLRVYGGSAGRNNAILRLIPIIADNINTIIDFIDVIPETLNENTIITKTQKRFFTAILRKRMEYIFAPTFKELSGLV